MFSFPILINVSWVQLFENVYSNVFVTSPLCKVMVSLVIV